MADCLETVTYNYQFLLLFYLHSQIHRSGILNSLHVPWLHVVIVYLALVDFRMVHVYVMLWNTAFYYSHPIHMASLL